jgi:hypothetical protein
MNRAGMRGPGHHMLVPDFYGKGFKVRRNFHKNNEKKVDFCDHSCKIPLKGVIFKEGNIMFSLLN